MKSLSYLNKYLFKYKYTLLLGFVFILASNILKVFPLEYFGKSIDLIVQSMESYQDGHLDIEKYKSDLILYTAILILMPFLGAVMTFFMRQTIIVTSRKIERDLKNEIFEKYQKLSISFYKDNKIGDLMNRISEDVGHVRMYLGPGIMYTVNMSIITSLIVYRMLGISANLTLWAFIPLPILSFCIYFISKIINKQSLKVQESQSNLSSIVQEVFSGVRVIKSYAQEKVFEKFYNEEADNYKNKNLELIKTNAYFFPMMILFIGLSNLITLYFGGKYYIEGQLKLGVVIEFFAYINLLIWPFTSIGWVTSVVQRAAASQKRINEFLNTDIDIINNSNKAFDIQGDIRFEKVKLTYTNTGIEALKGISFALKKGETLAIIGETGSGKSSVGQLINRLYDANKGRVFIDDKSIKEVNLTALREQIGYVPQESFLFSDTIYNNIKFGAKEATKEMVENAAKIAGVYKNIMRFDKGFDTIVGERGVTLSGGQKQRISIARALIKKPKIFIFDDCLSAVDADTERLIFENLKAEMKNVTTIFITHRLSSVQYADKIAVLKNGLLAEYGSPEDLMKTGTYYQYLMTLQKEG